jgi:excisionase family DNA binding protein
MQWLSVAESAERLDWDESALRRLLVATGGSVLPGSIQEGDGGWSVPESALRRITGAGLFLFSVTTLSELLDCHPETLREMIRGGRLRAVRIDGIGQRVPWSEYQRLLGRGAGK